MYLLYQDKHELLLHHDDMTELRCHRTQKKPPWEMILYQGHYQLTKETKRARCIPHLIALYFLFCELVPLSDHDLDILSIRGLFAVRDQDMGTGAIAERGFILRTFE